jgi:uncharacterized YccA/Bax inhibitor family protein
LFKIDKYIYAVIERISIKAINIIVRCNTMEENSKSGLYVVAVVGIVAVISLVVLVLNSGAKSTTSTQGLSAEDSAGQAAAVLGKCPYNCYKVCIPKICTFTNSTGTAGNVRYECGETCANRCGYFCDI